MLINGSPKRPGLLRRCYVQKRTPFADATGKKTGQNGRLAFLPCSMAAAQEEMGSISTDEPRKRRAPPELTPEEIRQRIVALKAQYEATVAGSTRIVVAGRPPLASGSRPKVS